MAEQSEQDNPLYWAKTNDAEIDAGSQRARDTFRYFIRELSWERRRIIKGLDVAVVKIAFGEQASPEAAPIVEHMWIGDVDFDGAIVRGRLLNDPHHVQSVRQGQGVQVPFAQMSDWMYAQRSTAYGGFTVNVLRSRMSDAERRQHDDAWGLEFGDPYDVSVIPNRVITEKSGLFGRKKQITVAGDPAAEHPMALNVAASMDESLAKDPGLAHWRDERGWTHVHDLAMAGSVVCVNAFLDRGADPGARTTHGWTPAQLAGSVGWADVVALLRNRGGA